MSLSKLRERFNLGRAEDKSVGGNPCCGLRVKKRR